MMWIEGKENEMDAERKFEKIEFYDDEQGGWAEFYVIERTILNGSEYLFTTQELSPGADAFIFKVTAEDELGADMVLEPVDDETELEAIGRVFAELLSDDITIEM